MIHKATKISLEYGKKFGLRSHSVSKQGFDVPGKNSPVHLWMGGWGIEREGERGGGKRVKDGQGKEREGVKKKSVRNYSRTH